MHSIANCSNLLELDISTGRKLTGKHLEVQILYLEFDISHFWDLYSFFVGSDEVKQIANVEHRYKYFPLCTRYSMFIKNDIFV